jgi:glucosylceramidase
MSSSRTRRDFMKITAAGVATAAVAEALPAAAKSFIIPTGTSGTVKVRQTTETKRFVEAGSVQWRPAGDTLSNAISIDESTKFQEILGFGGAFTDAACHNFGGLEKTQREELLHEFFDPKEMNFSVGRTCIGSSDYSCRPFSYSDGEADPELKKFSIEHDREHILPVLRASREINPELFLLGSPWSPPGWMKANGTMLGGSMKKKFYGTYAKYMLKFLQAYRAEGVNVNAVTSQNEVDTDQDGAMPACLWGQEYEIEFITRQLGPELAKSGLDTKIWILDHNYNLWGRVLGQLEDPALNKYVDGVAWHPYAGQPTAMSKVRNAYPDKHMYWTEGGPDYTDPRYLTDWTKWSTTFTGVLRNWSRCIIGWNLALDEVGKPNIGPFPCGGIVTIDSKTKEIRRSGMYWAFAHYSRAVRRGALRVESTGDIKDVSHVAFINTDGSRVAVVTNTGGPIKVSLKANGMAAEVSLPADSVSTLTWQG